MSVILESILMGFYSLDTSQTLLFLIDSLWCRYVVHTLHLDGKAYIFP